MRPLEVDAATPAIEREPAKARAPVSGGPCPGLDTPDSGGVVGVRVGWRSPDRARGPREGARGGDSERHRQKRPSVAPGWELITARISMPVGAAVTWPRGADPLLS